MEGGLDARLPLLSGAVQSPARSLAPLEGFDRISTIVAVGASLLRDAALEDRLSMLSRDLVFSWLSVLRACFAMSQPANAYG